MSTDAAQVAAQLEIEEHCRVIGQMLRDAVTDLAGPGIGFTLLLFDFGDGGSLAYMSNARRADMIKTLEEFRTKLQDGDA